MKRFLAELFRSPDLEDDFAKPALEVVPDIPRSKYICAICGGDDFLGYYRQWMGKRITVYELPSGEPYAALEKTNAYFPGSDGPVEIFKCRSCGIECKSVEDLVRLR